MCCHYLASHNNTRQGDNSRHRKARPFTQKKWRVVIVKVCGAFPAFSASTPSIFCNIISALPVLKTEVKPPEYFHVIGKWRVGKGAAARDLRWHCEVMQVQGMVATPLFANFGAKTISHACD